MRALVLVAVFIVLASLAPLGRDAAAKGAPVGISPDSGELGTVVQVWSESWPPDTEVRLYAAFTTSAAERYPGPSEYFGPIRTVRSDSDGVWQTQLATDDIPGLAPPGEPGFLFFRADSDDLPAFLEGNAIDFVVEHEGLRPAGSGEIRLSIALASGDSVESAVFGWRHAGAPWFFSPYGMVPYPFETTITRLKDGEWEIVAMTSGGSEPIGEATYDLGEASLCFNPSCAEGTPIVQVHSAFRVTIENAQIVEANVVLGRLRSDGSPQQERVDPLVATAPPSEDGRTAFIAGASVLLAVLVVGTVVLGRRRARR